MQSKIPTVNPNFVKKQSNQTIKNDLEPSSKLIRPQYSSKQSSKIEMAALSNLIKIKSKSSLDLKQNKKELNDIRPQSVVVEKPRTILSRSSTKLDLQPVKNLKLHRLGAIPSYLKKTNKETTLKPEICKNEKIWEKSVKTGDFSDKILVEIDLQSINNELKIEIKKLLEENKILKENVTNGNSKEKELIQTLKAQLTDSKKDNNLLVVTSKKISENYSKEQDLNKKLEQKFKKFEEENKTSQAYSEVAKKISDKKLLKDQQKLSETLSLTQDRCKELEKDNNNLKAMEVEVEKLNETLQFETEEKSKLAKEIKDLRNKIKMTEDTQKEMNEQFKNQIQILENQNSENCKEKASLETKNENLKKMIKNNILDKNQDQDKEKDDNTIYEQKINEFKRKNIILQKDLEIAHQQLNQNQDVIQFNQNLLSIRSNLINAMQEKEKSTAKQINDLQKEIISKDKSYELELQKWDQLTQEVDMNGDIDNKSGVLQNLFSTVSSQQMEITKKDQTILYLKETIEKMTKSKKRREELLNQVIEKSQILSRR